ncbi:bifunctional lysine-specific demethylase and histidyl-hydroxylase NO66 [Drosophila busckii]|uniref:bifunctional lysine-specific demethylase and histidyl-hydroxylase NO66 n=1 Tax=Drosophila busckii TaxID=30019 RepID=UPI001432B440|nr:bifunctional lysine-specific demethylase and histidyl-hydroxylase NO66 [Drosophila busckii]
MAPKKTTGMLAAQKKKKQQRPLNKWISSRNPWNSQKWAKACSNRGRRLVSSGRRRAYVEEPPTIIVTQNFGTAKGPTLPPQAPATPTLNPSLLQWHVLEANALSPDDANNTEDDEELSSETDDDDDADYADVGDSATESVYESEILVEPVPPLHAGILHAGIDVEPIIKAEPGPTTINMSLSSRQSVHLQNSIEEGRRILQWMLGPLQLTHFLKTFWEKRACVVQRRSQNFFKALTSSSMLSSMLSLHRLEFGSQVEVLKWRYGCNQAPQPMGRAMPSVVWNYYNAGYALLFNQASSYVIGVRQLCNLLQEFLHCRVNASMELIPPNCQITGAHYNDSDMFILQLEGRQHWRLHPPPTVQEAFARERGPTQFYPLDQLSEPILDYHLEAGDVLYYPRGIVHLRQTAPTGHSFHIALSVCQQQLYADLLEQLVPMVLQDAIKQQISLRHTLPFEIWQQLGITQSNSQSSLRAQLLANISSLMQQNLKPTSTHMDNALDQLAKRYQQLALPPLLLPEEQARTVFGSQSVINAQGNCVCDYALGDYSKVRLLRANILRLVSEQQELRIYYHTENQLEQRTDEATSMTIQCSEAIAIDYLVKTYPNYVLVSTLPLSDATHRFKLVTALFERGLIMTEQLIGATY